MNAKYMYSFLAVLALFFLAYLGVRVPGLPVVFGILLPYAAVIIFIIGVGNRIMGWARSAVPFRITTTCGQQKSLSWIEQNKIDNPSSKGAVIVRMLLEVLCFRSLFRNTRIKMKEGPKLTYHLEIFLWIGALAFHYAFLVTILRHLRLFTEPVPYLIRLLETVDSFFRLEILYDVVQIGLPGVFISGFVLLAAAVYLFLRRLFIPQVKYISLAADYFPLFLIMGIAFTGIFMRYFSKVNVAAAKELAMGLVTFSPHIPESSISGVFYAHLLFVCVLLAYFPFSKLMHMGGIFLSPTRNLPGNTREVRHINPWNYPVKVHSYEAYEDDFREKMIEAGLPVVKQPAETAPEEKE
ncbi:MAG: sulfate reduction electron transfer complex DsrMKJOP subunit DsrM [Desulfobacteraceae bacterium]|nr:sulfate reduction electron transfer complex DsrMKJOP subunit DsrM [Desulfobacteraceae bacterium]